MERQIRQFELRANGPLERVVIGPHCKLTLSVTIAQYSTIRIQMMTWAVCRKKEESHKSLPDRGDNWNVYGSYGSGLFFLENDLFSDILRNETTFFFGIHLCAPRALGVQNPM